METAITAGSTIKLKFDEDLPFDDIKEGLVKIVKSGIGERRGGRIWSGKTKYGNGQRIF